MAHSTEYYNNLAEIALISEGGCAVSSLDSLSLAQQEAINIAEAISGVLYGGEIVDGDFMIKVIVRKDLPGVGRDGRKFVTVTRNEVEIDPATIY